MKRSAAYRIGRLLPDLFVDGLGLAGAGAITFGVAQVATWAGWVTGGALALAAALILGRKLNPDEPERD